MKYKLDVAKDVEVDSKGEHTLRLPFGWKFTDGNYGTLGWKSTRAGVCHSKEFDSIEEVRDEVKNNVSACACGRCEEGIADTLASK